MRRLFAIVVLFIFLLNVLGYYGVLVGLKAASGETFTKRIDSDMYDLGAAVTFKLPLTVPYGTDSRNYERVDGEFEYEGDVYHMVEQRLYQDTLYIVCIKDENSSSINDALADFVKTFTGDQDDTEGKSNSVAPVLIKDYISHQVALTPGVVGWEHDVMLSSTPRYFIDSYFSSIVHPPDRAVA